jgi:hypothetical protein
MTAALCVLLSGSFAIAGVAKLRDPRAFRATLSVLAAPVALAWLLPALEIGLAGALVAGGGRVAAIAAIVVLAIFTLVLRRLGSVPCRCFGAGADGDPRAGRVRNAGLGVVALALVAWPSSALWDVAARELAGAATVAAGLACAWLLAAALARPQEAAL